MTERFDIAVIGAGPAGAAVATRAARGGAKVVVFEKARYGRDKVCGDGLTPRAVAALEEVPIEKLAAGLRSKDAAVRAASATSAARRRAPVGDVILDCLLRHDNADERLAAHGRRLGLVGDNDWERFNARRDRIGKLRAALDSTRLRRCDAAHAAISWKSLSFETASIWARKM